MKGLPRGESKAIRRDFRLSASIDEHPKGGGRKKNRIQSDPYLGLLFREDGRSGAGSCSWEGKRRRAETDLGVGEEETR